MKQRNLRAAGVAPVRLRTKPTPVRISRRTRNVLLGLGVAALVLLMWAAPQVPVMLLGGFTLAMVLSFPVRWLSRVMPRWLAIVTTFVALVGLGALALIFLVPTLMDQLSSLVNTAPEVITSRSGNAVQVLLGPLSDAGLLQGTLDQYTSRLGENVVNVGQDLGRQVLGGLVRFVSGALGIALSLFGVLFVAVYLLVNVRKIKAAYLRAAPDRYRRDVRELWDEVHYTLTRYLSGLALDAFAQGVLSAIGLYLIGVPYALLLGAWVSLTAIVPFFGAWLGAIPAVIVALTVSPTEALLTAILYLVIQQIEGNILQPAIQGRVLNIPSMFVFLGVIAGGQIAGILGVIFAVPILAMLKVLFDFFRVRLQTEEA